MVSSTLGDIKVKSWGYIGFIHNTRKSLKGIYSSTKVFCLLSRVGCGLCSVLRAWGLVLGPGYAARVLQVAWAP